MLWTNPRQDPQIRWKLHFRYGSNWRTQVNQWLIIEAENIKCLKNILNLKMEKVIRQYEIVINYYVPIFLRNYFDDNIAIPPDVTY